MKINKLNELDIQKNPGISKEYFSKVHSEIKKLYGNTGLTMKDIMEISSTLVRTLQSQDGYEQELSQIAEGLIYKFYGGLLEDVILDIKIVPIDDKQKKKMTGKLKFQEPPEFKKQQETRKVSDEEIHKRKLLNAIMQGEALNVKDMIYDAKSEIDLIDKNLTDLYLKNIKLAIKPYYDKNLDLKAMASPEFASMVEVTWKPKGYDPHESEDKEQDNEEQKSEQQNEEVVPVIKVRAIEMVSLINETVKGIYELISANAIHPDPEAAKQIMLNTDTVEDEFEDIKYGPFIAKDLRDYINKVLDSYPKLKNIPNAREYVYGKIVVLDAEAFLETIKQILDNDNVAEKTIKKCIDEVKKEWDEYHETINNPKEIQDDDIEEPKEEIVEKPKEEKQKSYNTIGQAELNFQLNKALDDGDYKKAKEISQYIKESLNKRKIK